MLQQPSDFIMYQKLPLDLNMRSADVSNLQPDFKDIGLQLQAQRTTAAQAFFFDAYSVRAAVPTPAPMGAAGIQSMYDYPIQAMYDPIRHPLPQHHHPPLHQQQHPQHHHPHQQQLQHQYFAPMAGAGSMGSWQQQQQQENRGCWFPNWQDFFHGFAATKEGQQQKQGVAPSLQQQALQQGVVVAPPLATMHATISVAETQKPRAGSDGAQALDPRPLTPPRSHHDHAAAPLPYSVPDMEKKMDDILITPQVAAAGARAGATEAHQQPHALLSDPRSLSPACARPTTALLPCPAPEAEKGKESNLLPCVDLRDPPSPPTVDAIAFKYTTESPSWLPQGWITEVQTRRTGTTAGTRDKYYKDLVSGRRFRSRNEVMHFLETGKGRIRKRRRKAIASSGFGGSFNLLANQPHSLGHDATSSPCLFLAPQPIGFLLGPLVTTHSVHGGVGGASAAPAATAAAATATAVDVEAPCQTPMVFPTTSSMQEGMLGLKRPGDGRPQKLPVYKKAKILSHQQKCEDKQASRLWQWLQKPARTDEQAQKQDAQRHLNVDRGKNVAEMKDQRNAESSDRERGIARSRTAQLSREIEAAQRTVMHLGKEMQATVEKLTRDIRAAQKDIELEMQATPRSDDDAIGSVIQAAQRLDSVMGDVKQATQSLLVAMGNAVQATQSPDFNVGSVSPAAKQPQAVVSSVVEGAPRPDIATQSALRGYTTEAAERPELAMGYFMQAHRTTGGMMAYATEATQRPDITRGYITHPVPMLDGTMRYAIQAAQMPEGAAMCNQILAHQSPFLVMSYASNQAARMLDVATSVADVTGAPPLNIERLSRDMDAYRKALEVSKQIVEARSRHIKKFAALNPTLDLTILSPSLSSRQRAKAVQRLKAKHSRGLLVLLGRKLCYKALCARLL